MVKLKFYNGLREIGGTFVKTETEKAVCMFDFGFAVSNCSDPAVKMRKDNFTEDYINFGLLPKVDGIYQENTAKKLNLKPYSAADKPHFFFISHMHIDHMGGLDMLHPDIPVYMSEDSLKLYRRLCAQKDIVWREHPNCIGIPYGESFTVEDITCKVIAIDHDIVGACGCLISTPEGSICYTGDYRFHGFHPEKTENFAAECKNANLLITEGVTVSNSDVDMLSLAHPEDNITSEYTLISQIEKAAQESDGMFVVNLYNRNVERVHNFVSALSNLNRKLVLESQTADYLNAFYPDDDIYVYLPTCNADCVQNKYHIVTREDILNNPSEYVLQLDYSNHCELFDLKDVCKLYIHCDGVPLGSYDPSFAKLQNLLARHNIPYRHINTGGHAYPFFIKKLIDTIKPKVLIPLHSYRPEQVNSYSVSKRILPNPNEEFILKEILQ